MPPLQIAVATIYSYIFMHQVAFRNNAMVGAVINHITLPLKKALAARLQNKESYHE
jgi:proteasome assembly chaperone (PAC2) family protein